MRRALLLAAVIAAATTALVTAAKAGSYDVLSCADAAGGANHAWESSTNDPAHITVSVVCPPGGDLYGGLALTSTLGSGTVMAGSHAEWEFTAPPGTTITRWRYDRRLGKDQDNGWQPTAQLGDGTVLDMCSIAFPATDCGVGGDLGTAQSARDESGLSQTSLKFTLECAATGGSLCTTGATIRRVWASLYASTVTVSESVDPTVGAPSGALAGSGWHTGSVDVSLSALDAAPGVGIKETRVYVDGIQHSSQSPPTGNPSSGSEWECDFTYPKPCTDAGVVGHSIDTAVLSDGTHLLRVAAVDAANNETLSSPVTIKVDNSAPEAQVGRPWSIQSFVAIPVSWSASDGAGAGVLSHDIEVSVDGAGWHPWLSATNASSADYLGQPGSRYRFRTRARDGVGLVGDWATSEETTITRAPVGPGTNPVQPVGPGTGAVSEDGQSDPALVLKSLKRRAGRLYVTGSISRSARGRVRVTWSGRAGRRPGRVSKWARIAGGRFRAVLTVHGRGKLTLAYGGDTRHAPRVLRAKA